MSKANETYQKNRHSAILKILKILNSRLLVVCKSSRDEALTLVEEYGITTKELIEVWADLATRV